MKFRYDITNSFAPVSSREIVNGIVRDRLSLRLTGLLLMEATG